MLTVRLEPHRVRRPKMVFFRVFGKGIVCPYQRPFQRKSATLGLLHLWFKLRRQGASANGPVWAAPKKHRLEITLPQAVQTVSVVLDKTGLLKVKTRDPSMKRCPRVHQVCSGQKSQQAGWA